MDRDIIDGPDDNWSPIGGHQFIHMPLLRRRRLAGFALRTNGFHHLLRVCACVCFLRTATRLSFVSQFGVARVTCESESKTDADDSVIAYRHTSFCLFCFFSVFLLFDRSRLQPESGSILVGFFSFSPCPPPHSNIEGQKKRVVISNRTFAYFFGAPNPIRLYRRIYT